MTAVASITLPQPVERGYAMANELKFIGLYSLRTVKKLVSYLQLSCQPKCILMILTDLLHFPFPLITLDWMVASVPTLFLTALGVWPEQVMQRSGK